jgi:phage terminase large subunit
LSQAEVKEQIKVPPKLRDMFIVPRGELRYRGAYGGRAGGKSFTFALMAAIWGYREPLRILCTRELQNSIKESFHSELKNAIASYPWLEASYNVGVDYIRGKNGTEFIFKGLKHNNTSIKSLAQIDLCIVEEAEDVPEESWMVLEPTIRSPKSEIWVIWNPRLENSPTDKRFRKNSPPRSMIVEVNYSDNPWLPAEVDEQRAYAQRVMDDSTYAHVWEGGYLKNTDAQVLANKYVIQDFQPQADWHGPYFGADWGFSKDPTTLVKCWVHDHKLYIEHEAYGVGVEITETPALFDSVPGSRKHTIRADSARPETISYMRRAGFNIVAAKKGPGSVEDGVAHLRGYEKIVINPRCKYTAQEARLWSYKVDKLSGDVLPVLVDANNNLWDAVRYSVEPIMRPNNLIMEWA